MELAHASRLCHCLACRSQVMKDARSPRLTCRTSPDSHARGTGIPTSLFYNIISIVKCQCPTDQGRPIPAQPIPVKAPPNLCLTDLSPCLHMHTANLYRIIRLAIWALYKWFHLWKDDLSFKWQILALMAYWVAKGGSLSINAKQNEDKQWVTSGSYSLSARPE